MSLIPEINGASIVVRGSFNPTIFHPVWFKTHTLIRDEEADTAELEVTHPEISVFSVDWFRLQVMRERFSIETTDSAHFEPLRDLVSGTFSLLEHTPVSAVGLNRMMHFKMPSKEKWHAFGHLIAPKKVWNGIMKQPGLKSLTMQDSRTDPRGYTEVKVEPSRRLEPGVFVLVNIHYEIEKQDVQHMLRILKESWEKDLMAAQGIVDHLMRQEF
jgi:hypothetical protein